MIPDPAPPFEVWMSDTLREHIRQLGERASTRGIGPAFRTATEQILTSLRDDPRRAGDPLRHLRGMASLLYRIHQNDLTVYYTVHDRIPMVNVWQFDPGPHHPLAPAPPNGN
jgi:hypothetical protein